MNTENKFRKVLFPKLTHSETNSVAKYALFKHMRFFAKFFNLEAQMMVSYGCMSSSITQTHQTNWLIKIKQELLSACKEEQFEVHHAPPHFWNDKLDQKLLSYLSYLPKENYSTCPICQHQLIGAKHTENFHDPWWIYPQRSFGESETCPHFEFLSFAILWGQSEPISAPWLIPCGWGVPALTNEMAHNDNLALTIKTTTLTNGATIFWMGFYRKYPGIPLFNDFWPLPCLKMRTHSKHSLSTKGFWSGYAPLTVHSPIVWSKLYIEQKSGEWRFYEQDKDADFWLKIIQNWQSLAYTQPYKMHQENMVSECGIASFALGIRASKTKGALFISQAPIFNPARSLNVTRLKHLSSQVAAPIIQTIDISQLKALAQTDTLWAVIDPFQNEATQEWVRLIQTHGSSSIRPLWQESGLKESWHLAADLTQSESLRSTNLESYYRNQSPLLVKMTPEALELSNRYGLRNQAWGAFLVSPYSEQEIHYQLRELLFSNLQNQWVYFRYYDPNFLTFALSKLTDSDLNYFYKKITSWIVYNSVDSKFSMFTNTLSDKNYSLVECEFPKSFPPKVYEIAQRSYQMDLPRRIHEFLKEKSPEFTSLIVDSILDRWIRESIRQAHQWGIRKEANITKLFLWKVFITPTWCYIGAFIKILQQKVAEEIKISNMENLLPQLKLAELPRSLCIESWDSELWNELRKVNSPLVNTDPQSFHPLLGDPPPLMPLNNPKWVKVLGEFYEAAYADLLTQSGKPIVNTPLLPNLTRPSHEPPRIHAISNEELIIKENGTRAIDWLQKSGFERHNNSKESWSFKTNSPEQLAFTARKFLEEFPYIESSLTLKNIDQDLERKITTNLNIFALSYDEHHFWYLDKY